MGTKLLVVLFMKCFRDTIVNVITTNQRKVIIIDVNIVAGIIIGDSFCIYNIALFSYNVEKVVI